MEYREIKPNAGASRFIKCYWLLEGDSAQTSAENDVQRIVPDGRTELIFNLGRPFAASNSGRMEIAQSSLRTIMRSWRARWRRAGPVEDELRAAVGNDSLDVVLSAGLRGVAFEQPIALDKSAGAGVWFDLPIFHVAWPVFGLFRWGCFQVYASLGRAIFCGSNVTSYPGVQIAIKPCLIPWLTASARLAVPNLLRIETDMELHGMARDFELLRDLSVAQAVMMSRRTHAHVRSVARLVTKLPGTFEVGGKYSEGPKLKATIPDRIRLPARPSAAVPA